MWIVAIVVVGFVALILLPAAASLYTQVLWFQSVGQSTVFGTVISSQIALFALGTGLFLGLAMANLLIARAVAWRLRDAPASREGVLTYIARMQARATDRYVSLG